MEWKTERANKTNGLDTERTGFHEFGYYSITGQSGCYYVSTFNNMGRMQHVGHHGFGSVIEAKAAAQADFERRVSECVVTKPVDCALSEINELLGAGQGDDEGTQILPDFDEDTTVLARVVEGTAEGVCVKFKSAEPHIMPIYASPAPAADLKAENERLREALKFYADVHKYPSPLTGGMGDLWSDCGRIARAALNLSEPQT